MSRGTTPYKLRSLDPEMMFSELNRVLGLISDRLDQLEGLRGKPKFYDIVEAVDDVVFLSHRRGIVLKDDGDPAEYWRVTFSRTGTTGELTLTNLGRNYD